MRAIHFKEVGGPEVLRTADLPMPAPGPRQVRIRVAVAGVNFIDVYQRTGLYPAALPCIPGMEVAGTVDACGSEVGGLAPGTPVATPAAAGAYCEFTLADADRVVALPGSLSAEQSAALMVQGLTAHYLTRSTWRLAPGESCLVHAAAGGVGLLLVQLARLAGATVIATAGGAAKTALAREAGAHATIDYTREDFPTEVRRLTSGRGVDVVYDSVGASTWAGSLDCLRPRGLMVSFGNASGPVPPTEPLVLSRKGSLFLTRPTLAHHIATQEELSARVGELVELVTTHQLRLRIGSVFPLEAAASAHAELSARRTTGKVLLRVSE